MRPAAGSWRLLLVVCLVVFGPGTAVSGSVLFSSPSEGAQESLDGPILQLKNWAVAFDRVVRSRVPGDEGEIVADAVPSAATHFIAIVPCRVVDTRNPEGLYGGPKMGQGQIRSFDVDAGPCSGIPPAAAGFSLSFGVTETAGNGAYLTAWPTGGTQPGVATITWSEGQTLTSAAIVPAGTNGSIDVFTANATHLTIDINGYFAEGVVTSLVAGTALAGGGTGDVTLGIATAGVGAAQLGASAVTTGAIADGAVGGTKIANRSVVRNVNRLTDSVTIRAAGGATVETDGDTITVSAAAPLPFGTIIQGYSGDTTLLSGGFTELGPTGEQRWDAIPQVGAASSRADYSIVWTGVRMIVWGGRTTISISDPGSNTGEAYDPVLDAWTPISTGTNVPVARKEHTAVWTGSLMVVWGGRSGSTVLNDGGEYDPVSDSWTATATMGAPAGRYAHSAVWTGSRMIVWGGRNSGGNPSDGSLYDPVADDWDALSLTNAPAGRTEHSAVWTGDAMIIWGGRDGAGLSMNSGARYDVVSNTWTATSTGSAPSARYRHRAVWTGSRMIVWGGNDGSVDRGDGALYDPAMNFWRAVSSEGAPAARSGHVAIWTGSVMVVWGGGGTISGGIYDPAMENWVSTSIVNAPRLGRVAGIWTGSEMIVYGAPAFSEGLSMYGARWRPLSYYRKN